MNILLVIGLNDMPADIKYSELDDQVIFVNDAVLTGEYIYNLVATGNHDGAVIISSDSNLLRGIRNYCLQSRLRYFRYLHFDKETKLSFGDPDPCSLPNFNHCILAIDSFDVVPRLLKSITKEFRNPVLSSSDPED